MTSKKKALKKEEAIPSWISESHSFFGHVIQETIDSLSVDNLLSRSEKKSLPSLESLWRKNYNLEKRKPDSNPVPLPIPEPKKRRTTTHKKPKSLLKSHQQLDDACVILEELQDDEIVVNQICVPPLKPHWRCRRINIEVPAFVVKKNLIEQLLTWDLLCEIMEQQIDVATDALQKCVDKMLKSLQS
ncbi:moonshiner [Scaptodrosophila lebanonensis]|uniref:Moonshiner n=1 Tax=Drosophila lebanonensis TaxID=7225 RepID=A0A6J2TYU5_DROLE|nr:moonshiner [Scaptodrosophila lebanonensis]